MLEFSKPHPDHKSTMPAKDGFQLQDSDIANGGQ
jgi:hypothetical protein